jgi:hypothetical protein
MKKIQNMLSSITDMFNVFSSNKNYDYIVETGGFAEDRKNLANDFRQISLDMNNTINKNNEYKSIKNRSKN